METLNIIFIKDKLYNKNIFASNLYYSNHLTSFVRYDKAKFEAIKKYTTLTILHNIIKVIGDNHTEQKSIVKAGNDSYFVRIVKDDLGLIYDILIYEIRNNDDYLKYYNIFFPKDELYLDDYLKNIDEFVVLFTNNHFKIIKYSDEFLKHIGYQSWDYENKSSGLFDNSIINKKDAFYKASLNKDFNIDLDLICNNQNIIKLNVKFKYYDLNNSFYILNINK